MEFNQTKTFTNLAASFASECQAGMRYQMIAQAALTQGYQTLSDEIKKIAKNETVHANRFYELLTTHNGNMKSVPVNAGYPFETGTIDEMLSFAEESEKNEGEVLYPEFAETAFQEGFDDVGKTFKLTAEIEMHHRAIYEYLHNAFKNSTLFKSDRPVAYVCSKCGYTETNTEAFRVCPLCKASQGFVQIVLP